jgi:tetratricopeptide (TPR) repeat protein
MFLVLAALIIGMPFGARAEEEGSESASTSASEADSEKPLAGEVLSQAEEMFKLGKESYSEGKYSDALNYFNAGWGLVERRPKYADFLFNIARCEIKMELYQNAAQHLKEYLEMKPSDRTAQIELERIGKLIDPPKPSDNSKDGDEASSKPTTPLAQKDPPPKKTRILSPLLLITGGLAVVAGGIALAVANGMEQDLIKNCMSRCLPERYSTVNDQRLGGGLAIGGGAVFVGLGFVALGYGR